MQTTYTQQCGILYRPGALAYLDTFAFGLVPCKVVSIPKGGPFPGWIVGQPEVGHISAKVTATRGAYKRGQVVSMPASHIVPRQHVITRFYTFRIRTNYSWHD